MSRPRRGPAALPDLAHAEPFPSATAAWFWAMAGYLARLSGGRPQPEAGRIQRPCEPGDVIRVFLRLQRNELLNPAQTMVLARYGREGLAPDARLPRQRSHAALWSGGLAVLERELRRKGIVA
jgi:hypothetical protein